MSTKNIALIKPGSLTGPQKAKIEACGFTVIETKDLYGFNFKQFEVLPAPMTYNLTLTYTKCYTCGERIYMSTERLEALKNSGETYFCVFGHRTVFTKPKT